MSLYNVYMSTKVNKTSRRKTKELIIKLMSASKVLVSHAVAQDKSLHLILGYQNHVIVNIQTFLI